jgi:hypothetical protein
MASMRIFLVLLLSVDVLCCSAQIDIVNRTVMRKDSSFAFNGEKNLFAIMGPQNVKWQLRANYTQIEGTDSAWLFNVEPNRLGADTFFLIRNGTVVLRKIFEVIPEPPFVLRWGVLKTDTATAPEIVANRRMIMSIPDRSDCPKCKIIRFDIGLASDQVSTQDKLIRIEGNMLTKTAANLISKLGHGDKVAFSSIRVVAGDGRVRELPGFTIVIK